MQSGLWRVGEVCANIGSGLWILCVDHYESSEDKDTKREWIDINSDRLAIYQSHAPMSGPQHLSIGQSVRISFDPVTRQPVRNTDGCEEELYTVHDRFGYLLYAAKQNTPPIPIHLSLL